ncbi:major structural subunit of bundle-forming pilus [Escherichia coli 3-373-03_S4_C3]|uniref:type 4 pilus major pilin n=1 Tax=Escherichia coli TaxID=562 RepID=UPI0004D59F9C|nr:type 4 pilus major pilin [Escherichia coli]KDU27921.1 major structural subunit of bundle-forming pilus [Escherichia coli 3-373-03_S4_C2]KDU49163.1 major structural subunit of bundle-forming pilus [Escherichia coli 3-373-03_S4_C1]KEL20831.1 major structural subunit of bundle-forming pilus [Escherichia coli 3-373-03_S4_C3]
MHLIFKHTKINNKKEEKGLSLIESAMVLALAATVTAGVMFYYQSASDSNKTQAAISEVMSATSAINGLYIGRSDYSGLSESVLINSSAIPDNYKDQQNIKIRNPFGGNLSVSAKGTNSSASFGYHITLDNLPKSACVSLATLNLGTSAAGYGVNISSLDSFNGAFGATASSGTAKNSAITPGEAASSCDGSNNSNKVTYFMK